MVIGSTRRIDQAELDRLRLLLLQERATLLGHAVPDAGAGGDGDGAVPGADELDFLRYEQGMNAAVASLNRTALAEVDAALGRMDDGSYGACQGCAGTIPVERLEAMPAAAYCVSCQQLRE
jgi:RNA polymerase-binding transcription factor DksA